jgi:hypothetical protein
MNAETQSLATAYAAGREKMQVPSKNAIKNLLRQRELSQYLFQSFKTPSFTSKILRIILNIKKGSYSC